MPHRRSVPELAAWAAAHAASSAHPSGLFGPRQVAISRPASSRAAAAWTVLWASTPSVIMGCPFLYQTQRCSPADRALSGQGRSRLLSGHAGGATCGGDQSGSGHAARDCVGQPAARRSILILTESDCARRANHGHYGASAAAILCQDV